MSLDEITDKSLRTKNGSKWVRFIVNFKLTKEEIASVRKSLSASCEDVFFDYLRGVDYYNVEVYAIPRGTIVFPKVPLMRGEGPIVVVQLLETPFVNLTNDSLLVSTNVTRHHNIARKSKTLLEFGLRRAQRPDGGVETSKFEEDLHIMQCAKAEHEEWVIQEEKTIRKTRHNNVVTSKYF
ncbi:Nicotinate phosphoribosyltransferase 2, partial [Mucuna pruriens]